MNVAQAHDATWEEAPAICVLIFLESSFLDDQRHTFGSWQDADYVQYEKADAADAAGGRYFERVSPPQVQDNLDKEVKKVWTAMMFVV